MSPTKVKEECLRDAIATIKEMLHFDDEQAKNLISSVVADTPAALADEIANVVEHIYLIQVDMALVDLAKTLPRGVVQICMKDGMLAGRIDPKCEVKKLADGIEFIRRDD